MDSFVSRLFSIAVEMEVVRSHESGDHTLLNRRDHLVSRLSLLEALRLDFTVTFRVRFRF